MLQNRMELEIHDALFFSREGCPQGQGAEEGTVRQGCPHCAGPRGRDSRRQGASRIGKACRERSSGDPRGL